MSGQKRRFHPEGVASLVAVMLAPEGLDEAQYAATVDRTRNRILELADQYYKGHECDFDNTAEKRQRRAYNNLARLDRANLR
jgi:hypothetical protein